MKAAASRPLKVLLLDGHSLAYRAFYALPAELRTSSGTPTNAVFGFTSMLIKAMQSLDTRTVAAAFDKGAPAERLQIRPEYKAQRIAAPDEFTQQIGLIHEVLNVLRIPVFEFPGVEADDVLAVLARSLAEQGAEVNILTADRDFFQTVGPGIKLIMNKRGLSETIIYDEKAVRERYGFGPDSYLDYAALRGDPSDNIDGVPGIGEKTAAKLINKYGSLEQVLEHLDELTPKLRANLAEAADRLLINKEFFRLRSLAELKAQGVEEQALQIRLEDVRVGEWDFNRIRQLFDSLEFRVLYDRLASDSPEGVKAATGFEAAVGEVGSPEELDALVDRLAAQDRLVVHVTGELNPQSAPQAFSFALDGEALVVRSGSGLPGDRVVAALKPLLSQKPLVTHGSKQLLQRLLAVDVIPETILMDTEIAAYLIDPARGTYKLDELARHWLDRELKLDEPAEPQAQATLDLEGDEDAVTRTGLEAVAIAQLAGVLDEQLRRRGAWELFSRLEIPLARVLAKIEAIGIRLDGDYLQDMSIELSKELDATEAAIHGHADGPFNINSPPQLRQVLYERLGLRPSRKTKTGYSTDAKVLETLREEHPIVDLILRHREISKLKSTYIDALPRLVNPATGRVHTRFNQTVTTTGRLSSEQPNLQNIPIRTEEGKKIRRAFVADDGDLLIVADYSQIELRLLAHLSQDPELMAAFARGDDIHRLSISKALGIDYDQVTDAQRTIGKMVSYGVSYGMGPFGLSQRLRIPVDQARTYIEGFFTSYPRVRTYLDSVVAQATEEGFTTTLLGRRRYLPELKSRNPRVRALGERQALNAPVQGSAADIMKLAMVGVDEALDGTSARMVLTVHDELVLEAPQSDVLKLSETIRRTMQNAYELSVPLTVDLGSGPNWSDAKA
ncbi:MAG: DNA polymerase I [Actinomycetota bacterium]